VRSKAGTDKKGLVNCGVYARYSSDRQSAASIRDQVRKCCEHAAKLSWRVVDGHTYTDEAISGATDKRPGLQRALDAALSPAHPFDVLLVDDTSRLSRSLPDAMRIFERLDFAGVRIVAVSQGIDSAGEQADVLLTVHGLVDSLYIKELAKKTHRGMQGQALRGGPTGGRAFGYRTVTADGKPHIQIEGKEAKIVLRIFNMYAEGLSLKHIAHQLNGESVTSPRPQRGRWSGSWCTASVRVILRNQRYRGKVVWNRTQKIRVPATGRRIKRPRPESEWVKVEAPALRIIPDELWFAVQRRFQVAGALWSKAGKPGLAGQQRKVYLFSGLLQCGRCGGSVTLVSGRWSTEAQQYGCSMHHQRGDTVCSNSLKIRRDKLEARLLRGLQDAVLHEESIDYIVAGMRSELEGRFAELDKGLSKVQERKHQLETEIARLVKALADGRGTQSVTAAIGERERELRGVTESLLERHPNSIRVKLDELRTFAVSRLTDLRRLLEKPKNIHEARMLLADQIGKITLVPKEGEYLAEGSVDFFGDKGLRVSGAGGES
jgi:site-specific DNA recombinase